MKLFPRGATLALLVGSAAFLFLSRSFGGEDLVLSVDIPSEETLVISGDKGAESFLSFPVSITAEETARLIEEGLTNPLYDVKGQKLDDSYGESAADILVEKTGPVKVTLENDRADFSLPFRFESMVSWKGQILGLPASTRKEVLGSGSLLLTLAPKVDENWIIRPGATLAIEWERKPSLDILGQSVGLAKVLTSILEDRADELLLELEEEINSSAHLRDEALKGWQDLHTPVPVHRSPDLWLSIKPESVFLSSFTAKNNVFSATLALKAYLKISGDSSLTVQPAPLPPLLSLPPDVEPGILLNLDLLLPYKALGEYLSGQPMAPVAIPGGGEVNVKNISFLGSEGRLVVSADIAGESSLGGTVSGQVYLSGTPVLSREDQVLRMEKVDFDESSTEGLLKAASWIARPFLAREIEKKLVFPLAPLRESLLESLGSSLSANRISPELIMDGSLSALTLEDFTVERDGVRLRLSLGGRAALLYQEADKKKKP